MTLHRPRPRRAPRGAAYVLAVGLSMLLLVVSTGTLLAVRARHAGEGDTALGARARRMASSGVGWGLSILETNAAYANGSVASSTTYSTSLDGGTVAVTIAPPPYVLGGNVITPAVVTSVATSGLAVRRESVQAIPVPAPIEAFEYALVVGGTMTLAANASCTIVDGSGVVGAAVRGGGSSVTGTLTVVGSAPADGWTAIKAAVQAPSLPTTTDIAELAASGSSITVVTGATNGGGTASRFLLSPHELAAGGGLDRNGVYVLDCKNATVNLSEFRLAGTLVILDPGPGSSIATPFLIEPAVPGYPSIVVRGDLTITMDGSELAESRGTNKNFNPQGTPYPYLGGVTNDDTGDKYITALNGFVVVSGNLSVRGTTSLGGAIVGGNLSVSGTFTTDRDEWATWSPASAFMATRWRIPAGTRTEPFSDP